MKLYLDLSKSKISKVTLMDGDQVISKTSGPETLPLIDKILKDRNLSLSDISEVDSFPGPGSYTGLRIGAAIANALNYSLGKDKKITLKYE